MDLVALGDANAGGSFTAAMLIVALMGVVVIATGIGLFADIWSMRTDGAHRFSKLIGLPYERFVLPLRLIGLFFAAMGLLWVVLAFSNLV